MKKNIMSAVLLSMSLSLPSFGYDTYYVPDTPPIMYQFDVIKEGEVLDDDGELVGVFELPQVTLQPLFNTALNWADILRITPSEPVKYVISSLNEYNADAVGLPVGVAENPYKISWVNAAMNNLTVTDIDPETAEIGYNGLMRIGMGINKENPGWSNYTGKHALYHGKLPDLYYVMEHEVMHSLGVTSYRQQFHEDEGDATYYFSKGEEDPIGLYDSYLRIYKGDMSMPFDPSKEKAPARGMAVGKGQEFDPFEYAPYFVGEETLKVLTGENNYDDAKAAMIANGGMKNYSDAYRTAGADTYRSVYGLPILPADDMDEDKADLSHLELRNSYMSHQEFRNWLIPMEAELAVLKDLGYNIDLRRHFGKSYYLNNITDTYTLGYGEWDGTGYTGNPSNVDQSVGIHIYANNNNITQASDILINSEGSFGVRIDGSNNTYTLQSGSEIHADGVRNIALGVTWGKNHTVNVESGTEITANGENGIAVSFDFGNNLFGTTNDQLGSYISYSADYSYDKTPEVETQGALISNFNASGTLQGKKAAIYVSDNAYVNNINIKNGAVINGDIISEWNSYSEQGKGKVRKFDYETLEWRNIDLSDPNDIYYTNLNFDPAYTGTVNGKISGANEVYNTLKMNNKGNLTVNGDELILNTIDNTGTITLAKTVAVSAQNGNITGNGIINVNPNVEMNLSGNVGNIENTVNLNSGSVLSTLNDTAEELTINKLNSTGGELAVDLSDTLNIQNASDTGKNTIKLSQAKANEQIAKQLVDGSSIELFSDGSETLNLTGTTNIYYNNNKFTVSQNGSAKNYLQVDLTGTGVELTDAISDSTTANYIVTEDSATKDLGMVSAKSFEISGKDINVNGNQGLVVDGTVNTDGTTLKTNIYGASDSDITVQNGGKLTMDASGIDEEIGRQGETFLTLNNGGVLITGENKDVVVAGSIKGTNSAVDNVNIAADNIELNATDNVIINARAESITLNDVSTNTNWSIITDTLNLPDDSFLASDGTNTLTFMSEANVNLQNGQASDITLSGLDLKDDIKMAVDVDMASMTADRFVLNNSSNLYVNGTIDIENINLMNENTPLTAEKYEIPFADTSLNTEKLAGNVNVDVDRELMTPVYKYGLTYEDNGTKGSIVFNRASGGGYNDYNPAVYSSSVAAQAGGYLTQLNSYEIAFNNMDMLMAMPKEVRTAMKLRNKYASSDSNLMTYDTKQLPQEGKGLWTRPYSTFEKVGMKNGPKVRNTAYGSYFGGDSDIIELKHGWDAVFSGYAGYNGSHQRYDGNSIYQNGGQLGATGIFYKDNFFTGLTANVGASVADASTMYGKEDITLLSTGIASKTGYNWGFKDDKYIVQPNFLMSYTFVNTFDYTNAAGVRIKSDPLNAIQLAPGVKFIANLKNSWQPYLGVQMVWNIMDRTKFTANDAALEQLSVKPYVEYGVGVQKQIGERFTGYLQSMVRNGGRNGVALSAGFRWKI